MCSAKKVEITEIDKKIFKAYENDIIKKMADIGNLSLSKALSRVIGYAKEERELDGFFHYITHSGYASDAGDELKINTKNALNKLKRLLRVSGDELDNVLDNVLDEDIDNNLRERVRTIRLNKLTVHENNFKEIFSTKCQYICKNHNCYSRYQIISKDDSKQASKGEPSDKTCLYIPPSIFKKQDRFKGFYEEMIKHSVCCHLNGFGELKQIETEVNGYNVGNDIDCLYALIINVTPKDGYVWLLENEIPKLPVGLQDWFDNERLYLYCDYFVLTPETNQNQYRVIPIHTNGKKSQMKDSQCLVNGAECQHIEFDTRYTKKISFCFKNHTCECIKPNCGNISHILIFDNHQKPRGGYGEMPS